MNIGDNVYPLIGPHKGTKHRIIWVNDDEPKYTITPVRGLGSRNRYPQGAVRASAHHLVSSAPEYERHYQQMKNSKPASGNQDILIKALKTFDRLRGMKSESTNPYKDDEVVSNFARKMKAKASHFNIGDTVKTPSKRIGYVNSKGGDEVDVYHPDTKQMVSYHRSHLDLVKPVGSNKE